jgi:hypothetical protein
MIRKVLLALATMLAFVGVAGGPVHADTSQEIFAGCDHTLPTMGSAGYYANFSGVDIGVSITVGWQYVGGASSNCEDINVAPDTAQTFWTSGIVKVRTYMCNATSCWYNAWRNCQGGCEAATDMVNGTKYQVHFASLESPGYWIHEYD